MLGNHPERIPMELFNLQSGSLPSQEKEPGRERKEAKGSDAKESKQKRCVGVFLVIYYFF